MFPLSLSLYLSLSCSIQCAIHAAHSSLVGSPRRTKWSHRQITVVSNAFPAAMSDQSQHVAHGHATGNTRVPLRRGYCCSLATKHIRTITRRYPPTHTHKYQKRRFSNKERDCPKSLQEVKLRYAGRLLVPAGANQHMYMHAQDSKAKAPICACHVHSPKIC